jgi:guanylate kinase
MVGKGKTGRSLTRAGMTAMAKSAEEMSHWSEYDYVVVNRDLAASVAEVEAIVTAERLRRTRQIGLADFVNHLRAG